MRPICLSDLWLFTKQGLKCSQDLCFRHCLYRDLGAWRLCAKPRHARPRGPTARSYRKHCRLNSRLWMLPQSILQASNFCQTLGDSIPTTHGKAAGLRKAHDVYISCTCDVNVKSFKSAKEPRLQRTIEAQVQKPSLSSGPCRFIKRIAHAIPGDRLS